MEVTLKSSIFIGFSLTKTIQRAWGTVARFMETWGTHTPWWIIPIENGDSPSRLEFSSLRGFARAVVVFGHPLKDTIPVWKRFRNSSSMSDFARFRSFFSGLQEGMMKFTKVDGHIHREVVRRNAGPRDHIKR